MPPLIAAIAPVLATIGGGSTLAGALTLGSLATTGIGIGEQFANRPGGAPKPAATAPAGPSTSALTSAIAPQALTIESLTGGSVSPEYLSTIAPLLAGVAGQPNTPGAAQNVINQILGSNPGGGGGTATAPFTPSSITTNLQDLGRTPGLSDFLSKLSTQIA